MKLVFIDDSAQRNPLRAELGELVALGAVIVPDDQVTGFASRVGRPGTGHTATSGVSKHEPSYG